MRDGLQHVLDFLFFVVLFFVRKCWEVFRHRLDFLASVRIVMSSGEYLLPSSAIVPMSGRGLDGTHQHE